MPTINFPSQPAGAELAPTRVGWVTVIIFARGPMPALDGIRPGLFFFCLMFRRRGFRAGKLIDVPAAAIRGICSPPSGPWPSWLGLRKRLETHLGAEGPVLERKFYGPRPSESGPDIALCKMNGPDRKENEYRKIPRPARGKVRASYLRKGNIAR